MEARCSNPVFPTDSNPQGGLFGGTPVSWMDKAGPTGARRRCRPRKADGPRRGPRGRWGRRSASAAGASCLATVLGSGMAFLDATVVNIALPSIGEDFDASLAQLQWTVNAYALTLAGLILIGWATTSGGGGSSCGGRLACDRLAALRRRPHGRGP